MCLTSFGDEFTGPPALPCTRDDALVDNGVAAPKPCLSPAEMRTRTAAGGLLPTGKASAATRIIFHQPPLWFYLTEEIKYRTSNQYTTDYSSFWKLKVFKTKSRYWCSILAVLQVVYAPVRFWERGARCFVGRFSFGRRMVPVAGAFFGRWKV